MPCDQLRVQLGNNSEPHWQGSSLRMMYLVRSASLRNIILRLRRLAPEAAILPVVCNVYWPRFHWGMYFERGRYRHFLTVICGRNCALMYGEILDPNLPFLRCKTFSGLAFRTGPPDRRTSRYAAALQQSWPVPLGPLGARATTLFKRNSTSCLIGTHAGVLPWLRLRTVFRHPCLQTRGGDSR